LISLLVAMDKNRLIGVNNQLPWHLPADLAYFKKVTMGHPIIMGRKTFEAIGKPLPGRTNIIITRNPDYQAKDCKVYTSLPEAVHNYEEAENVFVIGGAQIFKQSLPFADKLYITFIDHTFTGDTYFPEINMDEWVLESDVPGVTDEKNPYPYCFKVYRRAK
jgi:dihydrofolate reductase